VKRILDRAIFLCCLISLAGTSADAEEWGPWEAPLKRKERTTDENLLLESAIQVFQKYISPVDGQRCAMYPTCSAFAARAINKHGSVFGTFIFVDRLYHESDPSEQQVPINKHGYIRFYDPVENNDFWLAR
jgi:putative component of membrane protein insertase Oxa1/YidC/SpoIIIJ protein YidD